MNRLAGIVLAACGFLLAIISVIGILPGFTSTGVIALLAGGLIIGLSFITPPPTDGTEKMSAVSSLINIFVSPIEVFRNLRRHPQWLVAAILITLFSTVFTNLFTYRLTAERITNHTIDKTLEMPMMNEEAKAQIELSRPKSIEDAKNPAYRVAGAITSFTAGLFGYAIMAVIFFLFVIAMGGSINYLQAFSIVVYAYFPIALLRGLLGSVLLLIKDPSEIHPILGQTQLVTDNLGFLFNPADNPVLFTLFSSLSLISFYWVWLNASGLKHGGEKVSSTAAWTASISFFLLMVFFGLSMALLFPGFMS